jgi:hypothetical protein
MDAPPPKHGRVPIQIFASGSESDSESDGPPMSPLALPAPPVVPDHDLTVVDVHHRATGVPVDGSDDEASGAVQRDAGALAPLAIAAPPLRYVGSLPALTFGGSLFSDSSSILAYLQARNQGDTQMVCVEPREHSSPSESESRPQKRRGTGLEFHEPLRLEPPPGHVAWVPPLNVEDRDPPSASDTQKTPSSLRVGHPSSALRMESPPPTRTSSTPSPR